MKKRLFALLAFLLAPTIALADDISEARLETARELVDAGGGADMMTQLIDVMVGQLMQMTAAQSPNLSDDAAERLREITIEEFKREADDVIEQIAYVYARHLTEDEMRDTIDFYKTPSGERILTVMPVIMQESMQIGQVWGMQASARIIERAQERFEEEGYEL